jgi:hypothetical protein
MILDRDTSPANDPYYIGGLILNHLINMNIKKIEYIELISSLKERYKISTNLLLLSLDWIYLLGSIESNNKGEIVVCF